MNKFEKAKEKLLVQELGYIGIQTKKDNFVT